MWEVLEREFIYIWYYFTVQLEQIFGWWVLGMVIGSAVSVFAKDYNPSGLPFPSGKETGDFGNCGGKCVRDRFSIVYVWYDSNRRFLF